MLQIKQAETDNYLIGDSELAKLNDYEIPLEKIFKLHEESSKNLVNQSSYPPSFVFNESFKQLQIPDAIISIAGITKPRRMERAILYRVEEN
ncbi:MAG: hypothetical protein IPM04_14970 [Saprospiraceae bacterium]|nr:hypothetical protein [Candidatus Brachybacter algidus]MBK8749063.1 hypothetical protein [Candidatus Brachybacter algidus]